MSELKIGGDSPVAVFDFDHTLTRRDSLVPFLMSIHGPIKTYLKLFCLLPVFCSFALKKISRQKTKEKILSSFLKNIPFSIIQEKGNQFSQDGLDLLLKPEAIERLRWHQQQNHYCILVTAALDTYTVPWGKRYGFNHVLASSMDITKGFYSGHLRGLNCWGPEKKRRLLELLNGRKGELYVYGDSEGDRDLLEIANYPFYNKFK